jgi:hypothetical protein
VQLVALAGQRVVYGGSGLVSGALDDEKTKQQSIERVDQWSRGQLAVGSRKEPKPKAGGKKRKKSKK